MTSLKIIAVILFFANAAISQTQTTGRIAGTVSDQLGAVIAGAKVTATSQATGEQRNTMTDDTGVFAVVLLSPGNYQVRIEATGFNVFAANDITVGVAENTTFNVVLNVGRVIADPFDVNALRPAIDSDKIGRAHV